jgi:hypothetical protein
MTGEKAQDDRKEAPRMTRRQKAQDDRGKDGRRKIRMTRKI